MFYNYGGKMKTIATIHLVLGIISTIAIVIICIVAGVKLNEVRSGTGDHYFWIALLGGALSAFYTLSLFLVLATLGEISENTSNIAYRVKDNKPKDDSKSTWTCKKCGKTNTDGDSFCSDCGEYR